MHILGLALGAAGVARAAGNWTVGQVVDTSSGSVTGHAASVNAEVSEYLGIPFAQPPVGDLRWTAPQAYKSTDAINGTDYVCFSSDDPILENSNSIGREFLTQANSLSGILLSSWCSSFPRLCSYPSCKRYKQRTPNSRLPWTNRRQIQRRLPHAEYLDQTPSWRIEKGSVSVDIWRRIHNRKQ